MTIDKTKALVGKVVEFKDEVRFSESDFSPKQRARVEDVRVEYANEDESILVLQLDFSEFAGYNKKFAEYNYYDRRGQPVLAWHETPYYPENLKTAHVFDLLHVDFEVVQ